MNDKLQSVIEFATKKHEGQTRWNGDPYITHPIRVSQSEWIKTEDQKLAAIGHDLVEDTDVTGNELLDNFGIKAASIILTLTHDKETQNYAEYIYNIAASGENAIRVKLADLEDNLSDIKKGSMKDKYELARFLLMQKLENIINPIVRCF